MICVDDKESSVLVVSENGYGKRSSIEDYRITNRGGKGVKTSEKHQKIDRKVQKSGRKIARGKVTNKRGKRR